MRRIIPGTKRQDLYGWNDVTYQDIDTLTPFQEIIEQNVRNKKFDNSFFDNPDPKAENEFLYELMRNFLNEMNLYILHYKDVCNKDTDPTMSINVNGEDLLFSSTAFKPAKAVPAMDYMLLTLAEAQQALVNPPNRSKIDKTVIKEIKVWGKRLYRIFAFCYFVHKEQWDEYEKKTKLCDRYTKFLKMYTLMEKADFYIPSSAFKK
jgi:hypothetical protein